MSLKGFPSSSILYQWPLSCCYLLCSLELKGKAKGSVSNSRTLKPGSGQVEYWGIKLQTSHLQVIGCSVLHSGGRWMRFTHSKSSDMFLWLYQLVRGRHLSFSSLKYFTWCMCLGSLSFLLQKVFFLTDIKPPLLLCLSIEEKEFKCEICAAAGFFIDQKNLCSHCDISKKLQV